MKHIKQLFHFEQLIKTCGETIGRFPITCGFIFVASGLLFTLLHGDFSMLQEENLFKIVLSLIVGFFLSTGLYITTNSHKSKHYLQVFPIIFSVLFYFGFEKSFDDIENFILFFLTLIGIIGYLCFAPFVKHIFSSPVKQKVFYSYFYDISSLILKSIIVGGVLFILGAIGIATIQTLFDISFRYIDTLYGDWAVITLSVIAPFFGLSQIPSEKSFSKSSFVENKFFSFLMTYTALPFIIIYFFILYAYSIKVLGNFSEWPKGEVSWLVIGFSIFGYLTYIFSYIFEKKHTNIALFRRLFPWVVFPQIGMLFYAIYLRVAQYDLTMNRYFVILFGLWLFALSLYYMISRSKRLIIIPASLTLITIIISIGPWSVYNLPQSRQLARLKTNLIEVNILQNGEIIPLENGDEISNELSREIYGGIEYLCSFDNCENIKELFPKIYTDIYRDGEKSFEESMKLNKETNNMYYDDIKNTEYGGPYYRTIISGISEAIKVQNYFETTTDQELLYISLDYSKNFFPMDLEGYSKIFEIRGDTDIESSAFLNVQRKTLTLPDGKAYDISTIIEQLNVLVNTPNLPNPLLDPELLTFEIEGVRIYMRNVNFYNPNYTGENSISPYYGAQGYILIP